MFYKNLKKFKKCQEQDLEFSIFDEEVDTLKHDSVQKPNKCKMIYNLAYQNGVLSTGLGFRALRFPADYDDLNTYNIIDFSTDGHLTKIINLWTERWYDPTYDRYEYQLMIMNYDYEIFVAAMVDEYDSLFGLRTSLVTSMPTHQIEYRYNGKDVSIFFTKDFAVLTGDLVTKKLENLPAMISCVTHYGYFFGILADSRSTLAYTDNLDITQWDSTKVSTIELLDGLGSFTRLVSINDYVYLFREHGITKISIYTSKSDFAFSNLYLSTSKIFENTICVCGNKVLFMTRDGLYSFNGSAVTKICEQYDKYFQACVNDNCSSACLNGKYYLATRCKFDDEVVGCESNTNYVNNALFEIDLQNYKVNILRGVDIKKLLAMDTPYFAKIGALFNDRDLDVGELLFEGSCYETNTEKVWKSVKTDLGFNGKDKKIKEIVINTKYSCQVVITSETEEKTYNFDGSNKKQRAKVCVYGKEFEFCFKTNEKQCEISKPKIVFDVVR